MKKTILFLAASVLTLTACSKSEELTQEQAEATIDQVYTARGEDNKTALADLVEGALPEQVNGITAQLFEAVKVYGPVTKHELANITPFVYADQNGFEATYNVQFENGEGTEVFKVRNVKNKPAIVGYSYNITETAQEMAQDSATTTTIVKDSVQ